MKNNLSPTTTEKCFVKGCMLEQAMEAFRGYHKMCIFLPNHFPLICNVLAHLSLVINVSFTVSMREMK